MKTRYAYALLNPIDEEFIDNKTNPPLVTIPVVFKNSHGWELAILGTSNTIKAIRVAMPDASTEAFEGDDFERFQRLRDYALDCIRLAYDRHAEFFSHNGEVPTFSNWLDPANGPSFHIHITQPINPDYRVNDGGLKMLLGAPPKMRPIVHLFGIAVDTHLPIQYRFLALYKIVELHYRITPNKRFQALTEPLVGEFQAVFPDVIDVRTLCKRVAVLRDRSAHIKMKSGELGFAHSGAKDRDLHQALPLMRKLVTRCVSDNYPDSPIQISSSPEEAAAIHAKIAATGAKPESLTFW